MMNDLVMQLIAHKEGLEQCKAGRNNLPKV